MDEKIIMSDELTIKKLQKLLVGSYFNRKVQLQRYYDYYKGKQDILTKSYTDPSKPCNKIVTNFCHQIVQQYLGFNIGVPATYEVAERILDVLKYNDVSEKDNLLLKNALIYGKAFELNYIDEEGKNRFDIIDTRFGLDIYKDELNNDELKYFIRLYVTDNSNKLQNDNWRIEVYDKENIYLYSCNYNYGNITLMEVKPHHFNQVPVVVFDLNKENQSIFAQVMSLQDSYNTLLSSEIDDWEAFVDSYLVLQGVSANDDDIVKMRTNRVLVLDPESKAYYLTKDVKSTQIENMLDNIKNLIFKISNTPDFSDPAFMGNSGRALQYKITGFNNISKAIMDRMEKALRKRIELIENINKIKDETIEYMDVHIEFTQNIPTDELETAEMINLLKNTVSDKTLISLLSFVRNPEQEVKEVIKQKEFQAKLENKESTNNVTTNITENRDTPLTAKEVSKDD